VWAILAVAALGFSPAVRAEIIDRIVAVVAGDLIMLSDAVAARDLGLISANGGVAQLIDRALILSEVSRYAPPEPPADAVTRAFEQLRSSVAPAARFEQILIRGGIDEGRLRERLRQDLRIAAYLDQRFIVPSPSEEDISGFRAEHPERFMRNGVALPLDDVRAEIVSELTKDRRGELVEEWLDGLRRRIPTLDMSNGIP
jgi:hypothetical protein